MRSRFYRKMLVLTLLVQLLSSYAGSIRATELGEVEGGADRRARETVDRALPEIERLRGLDFIETVPVEVIDDEAARRYVLDRVARFDLAPQVAVTSKVYQLLGLLPEGYDVLAALLDTLREQAGGFYDPADRRFYLLDDMPEVIGPVIVAHELTHALEDQHYDLDAQLEAVIDNDDRSFALGSVHEGSATLLMTVFLAQGILRGEIDPAAAGALAGSDLDGESLAALPEVLKRQLVGPYVLGASFLTRGKMMAAMAQGFPGADANRALEAPPDSSEQILHPEKYWDREQFDAPLPVDLGDLGPLLGKRWKRLGHGVLGELNLGVMVGAVSVTDPAAMLAEPGLAWTNAAASGWGGDRWELWERGGDELLAAHIAWDTEDDLEEFVEALGTRPELSLRTEGRALALVAGPITGKKREALVDRLLERLLALQPVVPPSESR